MRLLAERGVIYPVSPVATDEEFTIPFVRYSDFHTDDASYTDANARVVLPIRNQYILVGTREKRYISAKEVRDLGWSSDGLYRKVATVAYAFWIIPDDYDRLVNVLLHRHNINVESENIRGMSHSSTPFSISLPMHVPEAVPRQPGHSFNQNGFCIHCGWAASYITKNSRKCE